MGISRRTISAFARKIIRTFVPKTVRTFLRKHIWTPLAELGLPMGRPFDTFLIRNRSQARLSRFRPRYPFALERGPAATRLLAADENNRFGHEPELAHLIDLLVADDGVFLDVGANVGYFSIYLATRPKFHGQIHAFEPVGQAFAGLRELVSALKCEAFITCHQAAASEAAGTARMQVGTDLGLSSITADAAAGGEVVPTVALDSLGLGRVDFMKIDVEGHEAQALRGADALIRSARPYIFLESWAFAGEPDKLFEPLRFLTERGYTLYLPAWVQAGEGFFVGIGPSHEMHTLALVPFALSDRPSFPSNPINIFACPAGREVALGEPWSARS